jgi:hypothetical protein
MLAAGNAALAFQSDSDWATRIRAHVDGGNLQQAMGTTDEWLKAYPNDLDARAWHARLQAWTNHWKEAESEYRELTQLNPRDTDLWMGLADVLIWQTRYEEALTYIDRAMEIDPKRADCELRRAQALQRLGRNRESQIAYQEILNKIPSSAEARKGLDQIRSAKRHELRVDSELDNFSYADSGGLFGLSIRSQWNSRWATFGSLHRFQRFGEGATRVGAGATLNFGSRDTLTVSGATAGDNGIIPRAEAEFEYSHGFRLSESGAIRGIEALYRQRWLWYRDTRLLVLSPTAILYLPKDWNWLFQYSSNRTVITGNAPEWKPSGYTRLTFPLGSRLTGNLLFAMGVENYGYADQIGQYSMRTYGGGLRFRIAAGQEILGHGHYQQYSDGKTLVNVGASYAIHF